MEQAIEVKVPFTRPNAKNCICWRCPVQSDSQCIADKGEKLGDVLTTQFFTADMVPGLYCSSGVATCQDIDASRSCICPECQVWKSYDLVRSTPTDHYCKNGNARQP